MMRPSRIFEHLGSAMAIVCLAVAPALAVDPPAQRHAVIDDPTVHQVVVAEKLLRGRLIAIDIHRARLLLSMPAD